MLLPHPQLTTSLKLDPELRSRLRRLAEARRRTPHWLMREAIAQCRSRARKRASSCEPMRSQPGPSTKKLGGTPLARPWTPGWRGSRPARSRTRRRAGPSLDAAGAG